ncbi:MAG: alpha-D-ribose 1-methylphosphonate 5-triphosphate diphosphatase [Rhodobacteraceae bacterium HLUCCO07]|nr:MAG: alpha-D-ribose 1-methylphosphonate 5-triphosphate diphosphatase [Rhodobacteraceae bacterium HLUCCO07]
MIRRLPPLRLTGAAVLRDDVLRTDDLSLAEGRIVGGVHGRDAVDVDLSGYFLLPGIVDMHGDGFERHIAPRPKAPFPIDMALHSLDRELAAHGITTAWLAQGWSWEGGLRGPDFAEDLAGALMAYRPGAMTDMRLQIRCETHMPETRERMIAAVRRFGIDYVVFNNHIPEAIQMVREAPQNLAHWAEREGGTVEDFIARIRAAQDRAGEVPRHLNALAAAFDDMGVLYGSHDDPDGETRDLFHAIGARICEFPTRTNAAAVARAYGDAVVMGAPNVVRGGSQSGNVSASTLIARNLCDVLVSDYHYPALPAAAQALAQDGPLCFARAWAMISTNPARIMKLTDRGTLDPGKRADIVVMNAQTRVIEATLARGELAYLAGEAAARFLSVLAQPRLAAE